MAPESPTTIIIPTPRSLAYKARLSPVTVVGLLDEPLPALRERGDLLTGRRGAMSRNNGKGPRLELKLDLSLATRGGTSTRVAAEGDSPNGSLSSSPPSSCLSSCSNSPDAASMVLAGCPRCLMYVMLSEEDPKCPKCKSAVLLDFLHGNTTTTTTTTTATANKSDNNSNSNNNGKSKTRKT